LFLYRWLVLNEGPCRAKIHYLWNIRTRLGRDFLAEVVHAQCTMP
jgi:hypothetical protein